MNNMKPITQTTPNTQITSPPTWLSPANLFEYIRLYIDDQMIEEINPHTFNTIYNLYASQEQKHHIENVMCFRLSGNNEYWECNIPLQFWFNYRAGSSIPLIALPHSNLLIKYKLNSINNMIVESNQTEPIVRIHLLSDTILLDTPERLLFANYAHEYIITTFKTYNSQYIDSQNIVMKPNFQGLVRDIILISNPVKNRGTSYQSTTYLRDAQYQRYIDASKYQNLRSTGIKGEFYQDINILEKIDIEISLKSSSRYTMFRNQFTQYDVRFLMYLQDKFNFKKKTIYMYLKYMYSDKKIVNEISPVNNLLIRANGCDLFTTKNWSYFTNLVPHTKFKSSPAIGYYAYTFALNPLTDQPTGQLNFSHFDDVSIMVGSATQCNQSNPYLLTPLTREYNILRVMSGLGSLAWL